MFMVTVGSKQGTVTKVSTWGLQTARRQCPRVTVTWGMLPYTLLPWVLTQAASRERR